MQEVEWDFDINEPLAIREAGSDAVRATGVPRDPEHHIEWIPLQYDYPENFIPRFPQLLGKRSFYDYDEENAQAVVHFPDADFSVVAVRKALIDEVTADMAQRLRDTDWMVIEATELGTEMDPNVVGQRTALRQRRNALVEEIEDLPAERLLTYSWTLDPSDNSPVAGI